MIDSSGQEVIDDIMNYNKLRDKEGFPLCKILTEPFTSTENKTDLLTSKINKLPGSDGIINEF